MRGTTYLYGEGLYERNLNRLQVEQVAWRRKHDALIRKKEIQKRKKPSLFDATYRPHTRGNSLWSEGTTASPRSPDSQTAHPQIQGGSSFFSPRSAPSSGRTPRSLTNQPSLTLPAMAGVSPSQSSMRPHTVDVSGAPDAQTHKVGDSHGTVVWAQESHKRSNSNETDNINDVVMLAKKHCVSLEEVRRQWDEFRTFDTKGKGYLSFEEFEQLVRKKCNLLPEDDIPSHLLEEQCRKIGIASWVKFEAYLAWSMATAFFEEVMVPDPAQRHLRKLAREYRVNYDDIDGIKAVYDSFDSDGSGSIDANEFRQVLVELVTKGPKATLRDVHAAPSERVTQRYFKEVDKNGNGIIDFVEFLTWFLKVFHAQQ